MVRVAGSWQLSADGASAEARNPPAIIADGMFVRGSPPGLPQAQSLSLAAGGSLSIDAINGAVASSSTLSVWVRLPNPGSKQHLMSLTPVNNVMMQSLEDAQPVNVRASATAVEVN